MKYSIFFLLYVILIVQVNGQTATTSVSQKYDVVVSFGSMCCGTASDNFLKDYIKKFNSKNKITVKGNLLAGCGREGEFKILFTLSNLKEAKKATLTKPLGKLIDDQNKKNKTSNASSGPISIAYDVPLSKLENCRETLANWKL